MDGERLLLIQLSSATARYFYQFRLSLSLSFCWPIAPWLITSWWSDGQDPHPIAFTACANIIHFDSINTIVLFAMTPAKCIQYGMWILGFYCFRRAQSIKTRRRRLSFVPRPARRRSALPETAFWLFLVVSSSSSSPPLPSTSSVQIGT